MAGKTLDILDILKPDRLGVFIANQFVEWEDSRRNWLNEKKEIQAYVYATDTSKTSNAQLPWSNKTTIPKLCQIRDNLAANYMATLFPKRKWLTWEGSTEEDESVAKKKSIESYMAWSVDRNEFYDEVTKLVLDYIDYGNCIATVDWVDRRIELEDKTQVGYVGPMIRRVSPIDTVINPTAPSFAEAPKIIRSLVSMGEVKEILDRLSTDEGERADAEELFRYMQETRRQFFEHSGSIDHKDTIYTIAGFDNYTSYMKSNYVEILTFYGDIYDEDSGEFLRNQVIKIVDRHKVISKRANPSFFGQAPIYHAGWRVRPDNLWAMGPLDNLVGMQYRIDHLENMKADVFDLVVYPPLKIKGYVDPDFRWAPMEKIILGDDGDVELASPDVAALQADNQIQMYESKMEEMSGSPREAMGFRTPGEKTKFEVQQLQNAAGRIFQHKVGQFERQILENALNAMLELARRNLNEVTIRIFDNEAKIADFVSLTPEDITGNGRLKPVAARHFAEKAQQVQDLAGFRSSAAGQDQALLVHFSTTAEARLWEDLLEIGDYKIVQPYIRLSEQREAQQLMNVHEEQGMMENTTASGLAPDDFDESQLQQEPGV